MSSIRWACAALVLAATPPARAQELTDEELEELLAEGEVIEVTPVERPAPAAAPGEAASRDEIAALPGGRGDAYEAIRSMPGVAFASGFEGGNDLIVRGTSGTDSWYLVDGIPVPQTMHFGSLTAVVPTEMIESIELLPGGFDVEHGRATGGVVEIRTRPSRPDRATAVADVSFVHASLYAEGPIWRDRVSYAASLRRSFVDLIIPAVVDDGDDVQFPGAPRYADAQARVDWRPDHRHEVNLLGLYSDDHFEVDLAQENAHDPIFTGRVGSADSFWRAIATWRFEGERAGARTALAYGGARERLWLNDTHGVDARTQEFTARSDLRLDATWFLRLRGGADARVMPAELEADLPLPQGEGGQSSSFALDPIFQHEEESTDVELGAYAATDLRPARALTVTPGVRVDRYDRIDATVLQPRLAAELRLPRGWTPRASIGRFSRPHAVAEAVSRTLQPETAIHLTGGVEHRVTEGVRASATLFHTWLRDLTVHDAMRGAEGDPLDAYVSRGSGTVRGAELLLRVQRDDLFGWLAYTYARSRRRDGPGMPERRFDLDQPHNLLAALSWRLGRWSLGGRFRYASGLPHTPVVGSVYLSDQDLYRPIYGRPNSERLEATHQVDLRVDRRFPFDTWNLTVYLDVSNVYANPRVIDYSYDFDYSERAPVTDVPFLPSIGVRGEL